MRFGWLAAAAALVCAGQVSAQTFIRYQAVGAGSVTPTSQLTFTGPSVAQTLSFEFSVLLAPSSYTSSGTDVRTFITSDGLFTERRPAYRESLTVDATRPGFLSFNEVSSPPGGNGGGVMGSGSINVFASAYDGFFPTSLASNMAYGTFSFYINQSAKAGQYYTASFNSFSILGTSSFYSDPAISSVPETSQWIMMFTGLGAIGALARRRSRRTIASPA